MEHFSRLLLLEGSGQEFILVEPGQCFDGKRIERCSPGRCWHGAQKRIRGCHAGVVTALARCSSQNGRALGIRDSATSGLRSPRVPGTFIRGVPRFFNMEISMTFDEIVKKWVWNFLNDKSLGEFDFWY